MMRKVSKEGYHSTMETSPPDNQPIPRSCSKTLSNKIENLIEYSYVPDDAKIEETMPPLLSPYNIFKRRRSFTRSITQLISTHRPEVKEYVQSSRLDQCQLRATSQEQYVDLEIPQSLINHWVFQGYTALHFGAVRLILSLHGRKSMSVSARIALLDSSYLHYENAVIGTVLTILHAGSVVLVIETCYNCTIEI